MYVKVRTMDGNQTTVLPISKLTKVAEFRLLVEDKFDVPPERQRLFYRGKQMEDGHSMYDYNVNINDVIQLMIKPILAEVTNNSSKSVTKNSVASKEIEDKENKKESDGDSSKSIESDYYKVGDLVDAQSLYDGTWWEAKITKISPNPNRKKKTSLADDGLFYYVKYERYDELPEDELKLEHIRPRARHKISLNKIKPGLMVMVNYNVENPEERGFWYDCKITKVINTRAKKTVIGTLHISATKKLEECHIHIVDEVFRIERNVALNEKTGDEKDEDAPASRKSGPNCLTCKDNPKRKCKECGCHECGDKANPALQLMCDECDQPFHIYCLDPPLEEIPDVDEWYCPLCKNDNTEIVNAGEKLKASKKKEKMASAKMKSKRDWGKGMACVARQKICHIVPENHFGPIPGIEVGSIWRFRIQIAETGVHRPHVAGIHGRESEGSFSIVLSGGYEDDEDRGDEFTYTGSGGRDLSGNKRTAVQSFDQTLTKMNKALAMNCNAPINKNGAEAKDWKGGKPVRVVRSFKGRKHSNYAPELGMRYDGIYKIVKYWPERGKSGFIVWRYLLKRDDPIPAPWTKEGKKRIAELGLEIQFPDGYLEAQEEKKKASKEKSFIASSSDEEAVESSKKRRSVKRKSLASKEEDNLSPIAKKAKVPSYKIEDDLSEDIKRDTVNKKLWDECLKVTSEGKLKFLNIVEENFLCICCQILVHKPVTTPCSHNVCQSCLNRSFKADVYNCPSCRFDLGKEYEMKVNKDLAKVLQNLFPGYESGR